MALTNISTNFRKPIRFGLFFVVFFFVTFIAWAAFAPIKLGAVAPGVVIVASYTKVIQHQYGGTVKEILVQEGDMVQPGDVLIRLEDSNARAQFAQVTSEYLQAMVVKARLLAEKLFYDSITYPSQVLAMKSDPAIARVMEAQDELFHARRAKYLTDRKVLSESLEGLASYVDRLEAQRSAYERQMAILKQQLEAVSELAKDGYYPKNRFLELQRSLEETVGNKMEVEADLARVRTSIRETKARLVALERDYLREVEDNLAEAEKQLYALEEQYVAARDYLEKTEIRAPEAGIVMNLRVRTVGGVVSPAQPIMEIVPKGASLVVEAKVSPADIENVYPGLKADLRFIAIDPKKTPTFEGTVTYISPDIQHDEHQNMSYYLCRVAIDEETSFKIAQMGKEIKPGMPVTVIVRKGTTTFLGYLWKPFIDRLAVAFTR